jgi:hypothetical protein
MSRRILEPASWIAGIVSAIIAIVALFWPPKTEPASQATITDVKKTQIGSSLSDQHSVISTEPTAPVAAASNTSNGPTVTCPEKKAVVAAAEKAGDLSAYDERNEVYVSLVKDALCLHDFELAKYVAQKISAYDSRNGAYESIVDAALQDGLVTVADATADSISAYDQRNAAKKKVISAIRASK